MIGCTRCGATEDYDIISAPIAFAFKHNPGCGHGVGPLAVLPGSAKKKPEKETISQKVDPQGEQDIGEIEDIKVEEKVEESKPKKSKIKVFGKKD